MINWPSLDVLLQASVDSSRAIGPPGTTTRALLGVCACRHLAGRNSELDDTWRNIRSMGRYSRPHAADALMQLADRIERTHPELEDVFTRHLFSNLPALESMLDEWIWRLNVADETDPQHFGLWFDQTCDAAAGPGVGGLQFSTPRPLANLMVRLVAPAAGERIHDPCAGFGTLLATTAGQVSGGAQPISLSGQEVDPNIAALARLRLYLLGARNIRIHVGDVLREPRFVEGSRHQFGSGQLETFDVLLCDPPYGQRLGNNDFARHDPHGRFRYGPPGRTSSDMAFLQHALASLRPNGRAIALISHGPLLRGGADVLVRKSMLEDNVIEAVIGLPAGTLPGLSIEPALLILRGPDAAKHDHNRRVLFMDCSQRRDALANTGTWQAFADEIVSTYTRGRHPGCSASHVRLAAVNDSPFSLQPRRYVTRDDLTPPVDVIAALNEAATLEREAIRQTAIMERLLQEVELTERPTRT